MENLLKKMGDSYVGTIKDGASTAVKGAKVLGRAAKTVGAAGKELVKEGATNVVNAGVKGLNSIVPNKIKSAIKTQINKEEGVTESNDVRDKLLKRKAERSGIKDKVLLRAYPRARTAPKAATMIPLKKVN